uniref:SWIM-type zinc finger 7 associated protein 1 n=1 Tax=Terrapene triunguis TaxID=2587831 RepID=A0A674JWL8_9SAUR
ASLHQSLPGPPALLLLDGLEQYLAGCPGPQAAARLSALLVDTASYFTGRLGADPQGSPTCCQLIASMQVSGETEVEDYLCILQRYFPAQAGGAGTRIRPSSSRAGSPLSRPQPSAPAPSRLSGRAPFLSGSLCRCWIGAESQRLAGLPQSATS